MDATQVLLRAALLDSTNQQFLLLSETCASLRALGLICLGLTLLSETCASLGL